MRFEKYVFFCIISRIFSPHYTLSSCLLMYYQLSCVLCFTNNYYQCFLLSLIYSRLALRNKSDHIVESSSKSRQLNQNIQLRSRPSSKSRQRLTSSSLVLLTSISRIQPTSSRSNKNSNLPSMRHLLCIVGRVRSSMVRNSTSVTDIESPGI